MDRPGIPNEKRVYWLVKALLAEYSWIDIEDALLIALRKAAETKAQATVFNLNMVTDPMIFPDTVEEYRKLIEVIGGLRNAESTSSKKGKAEETQAEDETKKGDETETHEKDETEVADSITANSAPSRSGDVIDLSVLIPARSEMFLARTVEDILSNMRGNTEVIVVLDGEWADPPVSQDSHVNVIYVPKSVGQRAATNLAARLARGRYVMKLDAHCSLDEGFDEKIVGAYKEVGDDVTMVPVMRNLWAFSWKCFHCGWKSYQGPRPDKCGDPKCQKSDRIKMKMVWRGKTNPQNYSYCFDSTPHFQYFKKYRERPGVMDQINNTGFSETMSLQGSCFIASKDKYWELGLCDDGLGSWGNQGIEVALKTWLSGGRVLAFHRTWYAHMFRTNQGFSFPYDQRGGAVAETKKRTWEFFLNGEWDKQIHPVSWLVEKFWPVPGWSEEDLEKLKAGERT